MKGFTDLAIAIKRDAQILGITRSVDDLRLDRVHLRR